MEKIAKMSVAGDRELASWRHRHSLVRVFYFTFQNKFLEQWEKARAGESLNPKSWTRFVENQEVWDMTWRKFNELSSVTVEEFANVKHDDEAEAIPKDEMASYFLVHLTNCMTPPAELDEGVLEAVTDQGAAVRRYACQQFLKTVFVYAFANIYGKEFRVASKRYGWIEVEKDSIFRPLSSKDRFQECVG